jgi:hypothetical protein
MIQIIGQAVPHDLLWRLKQAKEIILRANIWYEIELAGWFSVGHAAKGARVNHAVCCGMQYDLTYGALSTPIRR